MKLNISLSNHDRKADNRNTLHRKIVIVYEPFVVKICLYLINFLDILIKKLS
jgi:hypothetical protein